MPLNPWTARESSRRVCADPGRRSCTRWWRRPNQSVHHVENLRPHYARTLRHWRERFERSPSVSSAATVRRRVRAGVASVSCRVRGVVQDRLPAAVSDRLRAAGRAPLYAAQPFPERNLPPHDHHAATSSSSAADPPARPAPALWPACRRRRLVHGPRAVPPRQGLRRLDHAAVVRRSTWTLTTMHRRAPDPSAVHGLSYRRPRWRRRRFALRPRRQLRHPAL